MRRSVAFLGFILALAGCAERAPQLGGSPEIRVAPAPELPVPDHNVGKGDYLVQPTDKLTIDTNGLAGLSQREVVVDRSGRISLPMIGGLLVGGKTAPAIEAMIAERLRAAFVRDPQVSVGVSETASQMVTVSGQVVEPGIYPLFVDMTLTKAVASAKGGTEFARFDDVVVLRTVNGQRYAALYNLGAIERGAYVDPPIVANDVVIVGDSPTRRLLKNFATVIPALITPLVVLLQ